MLNPLKVDRYFRMEKRFGRKKKIRHMKIFSIQENNSYNKIEWKTEANVKSEIYKQYKDKHWYIINPFSLFRHIWDSILTLFYLCFIYLLPLRLTATRFHLKPYITLNQFIVDMFFIVTIVVTFLTGVYISKTRTVVYNPSFIAKYYLKSFFIVDLLSSLPYDATLAYLDYYHQITLPTYVYIMYSFYYLKLLRFSSFLSLFKKLIYFIHIRGLAADITCIVLVWFTVSYLLLTTLYFFSNDQSENYEVLLCDSTTVFVFFHNITNFIFTLSSKLDHIPEGTYVQQMGQMIVLYLTLIVEPFIGAIVIVLYWSTRNSDIKYRAVIDEVNAYTNALSAPNQTKKKIRDYFKIYHDQSVLMDDSKAMNFFSAHDQMKIMSHMIDNIAMKVELFRDLPPRLRLEMVKKLKREVLFTGYKLTTAGQIGSKMYIVSTGKLLIFTTSYSKISDAGEGSSLGEYQLLADSPYLLTAVCAEISTIYTLDRNSFNSVILHLSDEYLKIREKITERHMNLVLSLERIRHSILER